MNPNAKSIPLKFSNAAHSRFLYLFIFFMFAAALSGCAQTKAFKSESAIQGRVNPSVVLLVEPDVELSLLTAAGLNEPHAEWTETGKQNVVQALDAFMREKNAALISYRPLKGDPHKTYRHNQILKMHQAVGVSILQHKYNQMLALPTKGDKLDWTLGADTRVLKDEFGAEYALFIFLRDSYATAGRAAVIVVGALLGVGVQGGMQVGFASLVDLNTGEVVWFNRLINTSGDLRTPEPARQAINSLLTDVPL